MAQNRPLSDRPAAAAPDAAPPAEEKADRGGIQSIERAFAILEEIARHRAGVSLAESSRRLGLHSSTAFHLVQTMVGLGYVRQMPDSRRYRIGRPVFALANACLDDIELTTLATPVLEALSASTGETAHFGVRSGGGEVVVVAKTPGAGAFQLTDRVGVVRPAHATALGKALLAALPPARFERYLAHAIGAPKQENSFFCKKAKKLSRWAAPAALPVPRKSAIPRNRDKGLFAFFLQKKKNSTNLLLRSGITLAREHDTAPRIERLAAGDAAPAQITTTSTPAGAPSGIRRGWGWAARRQRVRWCARLADRRPPWCRQACRTRRRSSARCRRGS
jgi:DNA-binding IclR family transcriptional regulator